MSSHLTQARRSPRTEVKLKYSTLQSKAQDTSDLLYLRISASITYAYQKTARQCGTRKRSSTPQNVCGPILTSLPAWKHHTPPSSGRFQPDMLYPRTKVDQHRDNPTSKDAEHVSQSSNSSAVKNGPLPSCAEL